LYARRREGRRSARSKDSTLVAIRFNPDMKAKCNAMRSSGKPAKLAITAVMQKNIELASALIRDNRMWSPKQA